jgi:hypothetical protein
MTLLVNALKVYNPDITALQHYSIARDRMETSKMPRGIYTIAAMNSNTYLALAFWLKRELK